MLRKMESRSIGMVWAQFLVKAYSIYILDFEESDLPNGESDKWSSLVTNEMNRENF